MRTILGPMRCQGCGTLVVWGETNGTLWPRKGRARDPHRCMFDRSRRIHLCAARVVSERVA